MALHQRSNGKSQQHGGRMGDIYEVDVILYTHIFLVSAAIDVPGTKTFKECISYVHPQGDFQLNRYKLEETEKVCQGKQVKPVRDK